MNKLALTNFSEIQSVAGAMAQSGFFKDASQQAQAIVKVIAGAELGIGAFASMTGINIIQGKAVLGANIIATLIENDPRYEYTILKATDQECEIEFHANGKRKGSAGFTIDEAKTAGLAGKDNWKKYPSDMLFARAISRGARRFTPGVFGGAPVYTPDELGADTDEDGYIIDVTPEPEQPEPEQKPTGRALVEGAIEEIIRLELAENEFAAKAAIKKSNLTGRVSIDQAVEWMTDYRGARLEGSTSDDAAILANLNAKKETQAEILNELGY